MAGQSILHDTAALRASRRLGITGMGLEKTIERLTTGMRINRAADDAAGLAISNNIGADIRIANQGRRNAFEGIAYLQVADGVLEEVTSLLTRALELTEQAKTGTISDTNRQALNLEFQNILRGVADIGLNTRFNRQNIFVTNPLYVSVADFSPVRLDFYTFASSTAMPGQYGLFPNAGGTPALPMAAVAADPTLMRYDSSVPPNLLNADVWDICTISAASDVRSLLYDGIHSISMMRASIGANQQQLTSVADSLGIQVENFTAAYSQIRDANIADEVINLTKYQILNQSGMSALGQANQAAQSVLQLLR